MNQENDHQEFQESAPALQWVDFVSFDAQKGKAAVVARCVYENGAIRFEGNTDAIQDVIKGGILSATENRSYTLEDGLEFMGELGKAFREPSFFATEVRKGEAITEYELPSEMTPKP